MKITGLLLTCDRCNASIFLKSISTTNNGGLWLSDYEKPPAGWVENTEIGSLCPECSKGYEQAKKEFLKEAQKKVRRDNVI